MCLDPLFLIAERDDLCGCCRVRRFGRPAGIEGFHCAHGRALHGFIAPEIVKQKLPLVVTTDEAMADYILTGGSLRADDKWYHVVFNGKDKNEGNVQLVNVKAKQVVWAGEAGDRSLWWGSIRRGGERKVADRIVHQMKRDLFK